MGHASMRAPHSMHSSGPITGVPTVSDRPLKVSRERPPHMSRIRTFSFLYIDSYCLFFRRLYSSYQIVEDDRGGSCPPSSPHLSMALRE
jgi:hypothetical protein